MAKEKMMIVSEVEEHLQKALRYVYHQVSLY